MPLFPSNLENFYIYTKATPAAVLTFLCFTLSCSICSKKRKTVKIINMQDTYTNGHNSYFITAV